MQTKIVLLPRPQRLSQTAGTHALAQGKLIVLDAPVPAALRFTAERVQAALREFAGLDWEIVGGSAIPADQIGLRIRLGSAAGQRAEGYRLFADGDAIEVAAGEPAGAFYGVATLIQLLQQFGAALPRVLVEDWPDLAHRGVMLDISRDKVPTMESLYALVDRLASWKVNEFQLYTEHTFAYRNHPDVWAQASPMTAEEILALDAYCRERFVTLVPNQASFGHMNRWFEHPEYMDMAESPEGFVTTWGRRHQIPVSLCPTNPRALEFIDGLYAELLPNFTSLVFNVNCDETFDLGQGHSKALVAEKGEGHVYLEFLLKIYERVKARGRTMQFWGDIVMHHPHLVPELPRDLIALDWWYDAPYEYPTTEIYAREGIPFYTCPGTSSWCTWAGRTANAIDNIASAARTAIARGAVGLLNTDWGDGGHWQPQVVSFLGFAWGAALAWAYEANESLDLTEALDRFAFEDRAGVMGKLAYDLGNAYQQPGIIMHNSSILWWAFSWPLDDREAISESSRIGQVRQNLRNVEHLAEHLHETIRYVDRVLEPLDRADMARPDADQIKQEFRLVGDFLKHGARRLLVMIGDSSVPRDDLAREFPQLEQRYREQWLARNRPGGLEDSVRRMTRRRPVFE